METYNIIFPFCYLWYYDMPLRQSSSMAYEYNEFLRKYVWQFIDAYNYQFASSKQIQFCFSSQDCIFEGVLFVEKKPLFQTFKINRQFLRDTTDFTEWKQLVALQNLAQLECLEFDFYNQWLSMPDEAFFTHFQQLREVVIRCHCTGGFENLINVSEIEDVFRKKLPHAKITMDIFAEYYQ